MAVADQTRRAVMREGDSKKIAIEPINTTSCSHMAKATRKDCDLNWIEYESSIQGKIDNQLSVEDMLYPFSPIG